MSYAIHNRDLGALLEDGKERPKLRLIMRARAKAPKSRFVENFVTLYRQLDEGVSLSSATEAAFGKNSLRTASKELELNPVWRSLCPFHL